MKKTLSIAIAMAVAGISSVASAEDSMGLEFSANVAMTSDYVFRGISQSDEEIAIQGGFDVAHSSGVYAGVWSSVVDDSFYGGADIEVDTYIGWGGEVGPVGVDVGFLHYEYPDTTVGANNTDEWHIGVSKDFGVVSASLTYNYSDNFFGAGDGEYWDLGVEAPLGSFTVAAHYGSTDVDNGTDYEDWSLGVSTELEGFGFDLSYYDTDVNTMNGGKNLSDDRFAFTISKSL